MANKPFYAEVYEFKSGGNPATRQLTEGDTYAEVLAVCNNYLTRQTYIHVPKEEVTAKWNDHYSASVVVQKVVKHANGRESTSNVTRCIVRIFSPTKPKVSSAAIAAARSDDAIRTVSTEQEVSTVIAPVVDELLRRGYSFGEVCAIMTNAAAYYMMSELKNVRTESLIWPNPKAI